MFDDLHGGVTALAVETIADTAKAVAGHGSGHGDAGFKLRAEGATELRGDHRVSRLWRIAFLLTIRARPRFGRRMQNGQI